MNKYLVLYRAPVSAREQMANATPEQAKAGGIDIVNTGAQHTQLSDRGPDTVKEKIQATLDQFLGNSATSELAPAQATRPMIANPGDY